jgi:DNA-binding NarL/FixJ family response regulator
VASKLKDKKSYLDTVSLWIIEDDNLFRNTMQTLLNNSEGMQCEHAFPSCEAALDVIEREYAPEVLLMDIGLPGMSGIEGVPKIKAISPATEVLMLTIHEEDDKVFQAICAGADGYLLKSSPGDDILRAVRDVLAGGSPMNAQIARRVLAMFADMAAPKGEYRLTAREKEILKLMTDGLQKKAMAEKLFVSYFTIDTHLKNIYAKLHVHSGTGAVAKVLKEKLL